MNALQEIPNKRNNLDAISKEIDEWFVGWEKINQGPWFHVSSHFKRVAKASERYIDDVQKHPGQDVLGPLVEDLRAYNLQNGTHLSMDDLKSACQWWAWTHDLGMIIDDLDLNNKPVWQETVIKHDGAKERSITIAQKLMENTDLSNELTGLVIHLIRSTRKEPFGIFAEYIDLVGEGKVADDIERTLALQGLVHEGLAQDEDSARIHISQIEASLLKDSEARKRALKDLWLRVIDIKPTVESPATWLVPATNVFYGLRVLEPYLQALFSDHEKTWDLETASQIVQGDEGRQLLEKKWSQAEAFFATKTDMPEKVKNAEIKKKFNELISPFRINRILAALGPILAILGNEKSYIDDNLGLYRKSVGDTWELSLLDRLRQKLSETTINLNVKRELGKKDIFSPVLLGEVEFVWKLAKLTMSAISAVDNNEPINDVHFFDMIQEAIMVDTEKSWKQD